MFPKKNRFQFKSGLPRKIINSNSFSLRFARNELGKLQVAVVVSKKVDKRAVVRNKIKRKFLEIVRRLDLNNPSTFVFYVKKSALNSEDLENEIKKTIMTIEGRK